MGDNWIKKTIRGILISGSDSIGGTHDPQGSTEITGETFPDSTSRGIHNAPRYSITGGDSSNWQTCTVAAAAYLAGDRFGSLEEITGVPTTGEVIGVGWQDDDLVRPEMDIMFFVAEPTIASADRVALSITEANLDLMIPNVLRLRLDSYGGQTSTDHYTGYASAYDLNNRGPLLYTLDSGTSLWMLCQASIAVTPTSTGGQRFKPLIIKR